MEIGSQFSIQKALVRFPASQKKGRKKEGEREERKEGGQTCTSTTSPLFFIFCILC